MQNIRKLISATNLDSILKNGDIILPTRVHIVKAMIFPVVMYGCESWIIKKAEHWKIDAFELWCWRLLRVTWTTRRSSQSILKEISPEYSLEGLMLKLQYFAHLMWRADSLEKTLMLGKIEGKSIRGWQRMRCLGITDLMDMSLNKLGDSEGQGSLGFCSPWDCKEWTWLSDWTTISAISRIFHLSKLKLCTCWRIILHPLLSSTPGNHHSAFFPL